MKQIAKTLAYWLLPSALNDAIRGYDYGRMLLPVCNRPLYRDLKRNRRFRNRHRGARCFILCNGPSILKQDLLPLRNEIVMSVSNGYLHKDFNRINPAYHLVPRLTYGLAIEVDFVAWFREMDSRLGDAEIFLDSSEFSLIKKHALFPRRSVNYFHSARQFRRIETGILDISGPVPGVITVPIMGLAIALYMGFKDIYLIGTEHDTVVTREYKYAFEPTILKGKDFSTTAEGRSVVSMYEELKGSVLIWEQYRHIKRIALANDVNIWNASAGGILDEFPRIELARVLSPVRS